MDTQENQSEIAKFLQEWDDEIEAIKLSLSCMMMTAQHDFTLHRMQAFCNENNEKK